jgi:hypothetical protein
MNLWCNKQIIGLIIGLILPVIFGFLLFEGRYDGDQEFIEFLGSLFRLQSLGKLVSISVLPNLLVFFLAIWTERLLAARGIVIATVIWAVITMIIRFIM